MIWVVDLALEISDCMTRLWIIVQAFKGDRQQQTYQVDQPGGAEINGGANNQIWGIEPTNACKHGDLTNEIGDLAYKHEDLACKNDDF